MNKNICENLDSFEQSFAQNFDPLELDEKESDIENVINADVMWDAANKCQKNVSWKHSAQQYEMNKLTYIRDTQREIRTGKYKPSPTKDFELKERGHNRKIKSHCMKDRVVQKSLNDNVLSPAVTDKIIYDNGASQLHKGLSFARERFEKHMVSAYRHYGTDGVCLIVDFSKYFDNIVHEKFLEQLSKILTPGEVEFVKICLSQFLVDVSYMSDEEYDMCIDQLFNALEYTNPTKGYETKKYMAKSVGIGSQLSQIAGIFYPHDIDNYFKIVKSVKYYGRYMDDIYMFLHDKKTANEYKELLYEQCKKLKIHVNEKKTRIVPITKTITYLKINYFFKPGTKKLIRKVSSATFLRQRRRIKKFHNLYVNGKMSLYDILLCYRSWRFSYIKFDSKSKIHILDRFFVQTFPQLNMDIVSHRVLHTGSFEWVKYATYKPEGK